MKKLLTLLLIICATVMEAALMEPKGDLQRESFGYFNLGLKCPIMIPMPSLGFGYRLQNERHGFDVSVQASTWLIISIVSVMPMYQYYRKPNLDKEYYLGTGIDFQLMVSPFGEDSTRLFFTPVLAFGKKYRNDSGANRFFQFEIGPVSFAKGHFIVSGGSWEILPYPIVTFRYGMGF